MRKILKNAGLLCVLILLAQALLPSSVPANDRILATVLQVYDGDTIQVSLKDGRREKVRFIGIDCPEAWADEKFERDMKREKRRSAAEVLELGQRAKDFTVSACPPGSTVYLDTDAERRDRYGRLLAYVWIRRENGDAGQGQAGEVMLNAELLRAGLARLMTIPPNVKYLEDFRKLERGARDGRIGIWSK